MHFADSRIPARVWDKVIPEPNTGCWLWTAYLDSNGYGIAGRYSRKLRLSNRAVPVHRWFLEVDTGILGPQARHQCHQRACVNPDHLLWGSNSDNQLDSVRDGTHLSSRKTHCPRGHEYSNDNVYWRHSPRRRVCLTCKRQLDKQNAQAYRDRKKLQSGP